MTKDEMARELADLRKRVVELESTAIAGRLADLEKRLARYESKIMRLVWLENAPEPANSGPCHLIARSQAESVTTADAIA